MSAPGSRRTRGFVLAGLLVALLLAGVVSGFADSDPDGLEKVAQEQGFAATAEDHALSGSPLADYGVAGIGNARLSGGLAGVAGVVLTFAVGAGVFTLTRKRQKDRS